MAKYSTGDSGRTPDDSCQICGTSEGKLTTAKLEGATLTVCKDCEPEDTHRDDPSPDKTKTGSKSPTKSSTSTNTTPGYTISQPNPDWVDGVSYGNTETPYLVRKYGDVFGTAVEDSEFSLNDLAEETGIPIESLEALRDGNATSEGVGRKEIEVVEELLGIELIEEV